MKLYNTLQKKISEFIPIDRNNIRMYICGPTVYDRAHIGNARPAVVFDVLYRLLKVKYKSVTYVRNITDIDDKIYQAAKNITINELTEKTIKQYHEDIQALNVLQVDIEPRATLHINEMIRFIEEIINNGYAYCSNNHVYFDIEKFDQYGKLSGKKLADLIDGARIEISQFKKHASDFVLWKPADNEFPIGFDSPWGYGRPGWHIECSAMSAKYLGKQFDIHGGGTDLIFPHHENEIAQSYACNNCLMANYWIHNGHVLVNGTKMSKSLGNFLTVHDLLQQFDGEVIRLALLMTHYRHPIDFSNNLLVQAKSILDRWYNSIRDINYEKTENLNNNVIESLSNDLNTAQAITHLSSQINLINKGNKEIVPEFINTCRTLLGIMFYNPNEWFYNKQHYSAKKIEQQIELRAKAKREKNFAEADRIRNMLKENNIELEDTPTGTRWKVIIQHSTSAITQES